MLVDLSFGKSLQNNVDLTETDPNTISAVANTMTRFVQRRYHLLFNI